MPTLGDLIKEARIKKGWTQTELANKIDMSQSMVAFWEKNIRKPKEKTLRRIADVLEVPHHYFDVTPVGNEFEEWIKEMEELEETLPEYLEKIASYVRDIDKDQREKILKLLNFICFLPDGVIDRLLEICRLEELELFLSAMTESGYNSLEMSYGSTRYYVRPLKEGENYESYLRFDSALSEFKSSDEWLSAQFKKGIENKDDCEIPEWNDKTDW